MTGRYLLRVGDQTHGPLDINVLRDWYAAGRIPDHAEIAEESEGIYYRLEAMAYLFQTSEPRAATPGPAPRSAPARGAPSLAPRPAPGFGSRAAPQPSRDDVWDQLERPAAARPRSSLSGAGIAVAAISLGLLVFAALQPNWISVRQDLSGDVYLDRTVTLGIGLRGTSSRIEERGTGARNILVQEGHRELAARMRRDEGFYGPITEGHALQSKMLAIAIAALCGIAGFAAMLGGLLSASSGRVPAGSGSLGMIGGLLAVVCCAALGFLGIVHAMEHSPTATVTFGMGFWVAAVGSGVALIAGLIVMRASADLSKQRQQRLKARRSGRMG